MTPYALEIIRLADGVPGEGVLSAREAEKYRSFKVEKRRRDWLGGRTALKLAVIGHLAPGTPAAEIEAVPDKDGRPILHIKGLPSTAPVSLTHSGAYAAAAVGLGGTKAIGTDLEVVEKRSASWAKDCFTDAELGVAGGDEAALTLLWTRKEAALKALGLGLSVDLKEIDFSSGVPKYAGHLEELWRGLGSPVLREENPAAVPPGYALTVAWI